MIKMLGTAMSLPLVLQTLSGLELHLHTLTLLRLKKTVNCQFLEFTGINLAFITWIEI